MNTERGLRDDGGCDCDLLLLVLLLRHDDDMHLGLGEVVRRRGRERALSLCATGRAYACPCARPTEAPPPLLPHGRPHRRQPAAQSPAAGSADFGLGRGCGRVRRAASDRRAAQARAASRCRHRPRRRHRGARHRGCRARGARRRGCGRGRRRSSPAGA